MSLHRNFFKETRSLVIVSASGFFLLSQAIPGESQERALPKLTPSLLNQTEEPGLFPLRSVESHPLFTVSEGRIHQIQHVQPARVGARVSRLYGNQKSTTTPEVEELQTVQPVNAQPILQTPPKPVQQVAGTRVPRKSLFDRLVGKVRGNSNASEGPPQDPGMDYTTASEAKLQKTQAPQLVQQPGTTVAPQVFSPPPVPGAVDADTFEATVSSVKPETNFTPRTFPSQESKTAMDVTGSTASPKVTGLPNLPEAFIPPMPDSDEYISLGSKNKLNSPAEELTPQSYPELKAMMTAKTADPVSAPVVAPEKIVPPTPAVSVATQNPSTRPLLDLNGPLPLLEDVLEAEKIEDQQIGKQSIQTAEIPQEKVTDLPTSKMPKSIASEPIVSELPTEVVQAPVPAPAVLTTTSDPLANPFPAEAMEASQEKDLNSELLAVDPLAAEATGETSVATAPAKPAEEAVETEEPYTGLSLEEDLFLQAQVPAPAEPSTMIGTTPTAEIQEEAGLATLEDSSLPELPPFPSLELPALTEKIESVENEELTPSREIPQLQAPQVEQKVAKITPEVRPQVIEQPQEEGTKQSKMDLIVSRKDRTGLKGFCPVELRDSRNLVDVNENYSAIFNNKKYSFSNALAMQKFLADPEKYAPAMHGSDVIHLSLTGEEVEGTLDYAVWFKGRLYLFSSVETMETFVAAPNSHQTNL